MSACLVVAGLLQCIVSTAPPLAPSAAADVMRRAHEPYLATGRAVEYLHVEPPPRPVRPAPVARRLDGTPVTSPPWELRAYVGPRHGDGRSGGRHR